MLRKQAALYGIAVTAPAIVGLGTVVIYSRMLAPTEYGYFALVMTSIAVATGLTSRWLTVGITRLFPAAEREGRGNDFVVTALAVSGAAIAVALVLLLGLGLGAALFFRLPVGLSLLAPGFAIFGARTLVLATNAIRRARLEVGRYAAVELAQAFGGLAVSLLLNWLCGATAATALLGTAVGYGVVALAEAVSLVPALRSGRPDLGMVRSFGAFSGPLTVVHALSLLMGAADQFFVQGFLGAAPGGLYNAVVGLANRPITLVFSGLSLVVFPHSVRALEREGWDACRRCEQKNLLLVLAAALPATAGLMMVGPEVVNLLLGPEYRAGGTTLFPWIVLAAFTSRMAVDVFDHSFYLTRRTTLLFATLGPASCLGVLCNVLLIPHFGVLGAALSSCAQAGLMAVLSIAIGSRVFRIGWPVGLSGVGVATIVMALVLACIRAASAHPSLAIMVSAGVFSYAAAAFALDVFGVRAGMVQRRVRQA